MVLANEIIKMAGYYKQLIWRDVIDHLKIWKSIRVRIHDSIANIPPKTEIWIVLPIWRSPIVVVL